MEHQQPRGNEAIASVAPFIRTTKPGHQDNKTKRAADCIPGCCARFMIDLSTTLRIVSNCPHCASS
jgi:hypothetical protein